MSIKVPVEFPAAWEGKLPMPIELGRIDLAGYVGRLNLHPDGKLRLSISSNALRDGAIRFWNPPDQTELLGFGVPVTHSIPVPKT